jgi:hypothetical protein
VQGDFRYLPFVTAQRYSKTMRKVSFLLVFSAALLLPSFGQAPADLRVKVDNDYVQRQFGKEFTIIPEIEPMYGDLDGDGVEDVVIAARCNNPLPEQAEHNFTVLDPYYEFWGFGDPKVTTRFSEADPALRGLMVLIVRGSGPDVRHWRHAKPKTKFVLVHVPFRSITVKKMKLRKKMIEAIYVEEGGETHENSAVYFDGHSFRYVPMGGSMQ